MYTDARPAAGGLVYEKQRPSTRITPSFQILWQFKVNLAQLRWQRKEERQAVKVKSQFAFEANKLNFLLSN